MLITCYDHVLLVLHIHTERDVHSVAVTCNTDMCKTILAYFLALAALEGGNATDILCASVTAFLLAATKGDASALAFFGSLVNQQSLVDELQSL